MAGAEALTISIESTMQSRHHRIGSNRKSKSGITLVCIILFASLLPIIVSPVSASNSIGLTLNPQHVILTPGTSTNVTLSVHNNDSTMTHDFDIDVDLNGVSSTWNVSRTDTQLNSVLPTFTRDTILVVRLDGTGQLSHNGEVKITVSWVGSDVSTNITLFLSVAPLYLPSINVSGAGNLGLVDVEPGTTVDVDLPITNLGNVDDTYLLDVEDEPDLAQWWINWTANQSGNNNNSSGNSSGGNNGTPSMGRTLPSNWNIYWVNDVVSNITSDSSVTRTLRITVPSNETPSYQGVRLYVGSTNGNFSISTILVVNVTAEHILSFDDVTSSEQIWLPSKTGMFNTSVTNQGTISATYTYSIGTNSGPCTYNLLNLTGSELEIGENESILTELTPFPGSHVNDSCTFELVASNLNAGITQKSTFTIVIGVSWELSIVAPSQSLSVVPGSDVSGLFTVRNNGSEMDEIQFAVDAPLGVTHTIPPGWLTIDRNQADSFSLTFEVSSMTDLVGAHNVTVTVISKNSALAEANTTFELNVSERYEMILTGPVDQRIQVDAGEEGELNLSLTNMGTVSQGFSIGFDNIPACLYAILDDKENLLTNVSVLQEVNFSVSLITSLACVADTYPIDIIAISNSDSTVNTILTIDLQVMERTSVALGSGIDWIVVGNSEEATFVLSVSNIGNRFDSFQFTLQGADGFESSVTPSILTLGAGEQGNVTVSLRRVSSNNFDTNVTITARSVLNPDVTSSYTITAAEQVISASLVVDTSVNSSVPGGNISGLIYLSNMGNAADSFLLTATELNCLMTSEITLVASSSSSGIPYSCEIPEDSAFGNYNLTFVVRSQSQVESTFNTVSGYTVDPTFAAGVDAVSVEIDVEYVNLSYSGTSKISVTVKNQVNQQISGKIYVVGDEFGLMNYEWTRIGNSTHPDEYLLEVGGVQEYTLELIPRTDEAGTSTLNIKANSIAGSATTTDASTNFLVTIEGKPAPIHGVDFMFFQINNQNSQLALIGGWVLSLLLIVGIIRFRKNKNESLADDSYSELPPIEDLEIPTLPELVVPEISNEAQLQDDGSVNCPNCDAKLRVPSGRVPPFKFKCPKCDTTVRVVDYD